jgi:hypothetical protein
MMARSTLIFLLLFIVVASTTVCVYNDELRRSALEIVGEHDGRDLSFAAMSRAMRGRHIQPVVVVIEGHPARKSFSSIVRFALLPLVDH